MPAAPETAPSTPCINVCVVEQATGLCVGCGRTTVEIARWSGLAEPQRLAIMARLEKRLDDLDAGYAPYRQSDAAFVPTRRD